VAGLSTVADDLWVVDRPFKVIGVWLGTRMTVVRLPDGRLLLHSTVKLDDELRAEIDALGPVAFIVAPNKVHHLFVGDYVAAYPDAQLFGAPGLAKKRKDLPFAGELSPEPQPEWRDVLEQNLLEGAPLMNEVDFLHKPSRTLLVTDLAFNISASPHWWTRRYLRMMGAWGGFGQSKMVHWSVRDRAAARASVDRILAWDFDRVIVTHGDVLDSGGKAELDRVCGWM